MPLWDKTGWIPAPQRVAAVLWITFLMAGIATGAFFSAIDPFELKYCVSFPEVSRIGAYTIGFLLFWLLSASSALIAVFFVYPGPPGQPSSAASELPPSARP
jgi:hypothetical protein